MSQKNAYECYISGYDVVVDDDGSGDLELTVTDSCNTLRNQTLLKQVLVQALKEFLAGEGETLACGTSTPTRCECPWPATGKLYVGAKQYVFPIADAGSATAPSSPVTYTVTLPMADN